VPYTDSPSARRLPSVDWSNSIFSFVFPHRNAAPEPIPKYPSGGTKLARFQNRLSQRHVSVIGKRAVWHKDNGPPPASVDARLGRTGGPISVAQLTSSLERSLATKIVGLRQAGTDRLLRHRLSNPTRDMHYFCMLETYSLARLIAATTTARFVLFICFFFLSCPRDADACTDATADR